MSDPEYGYGDLCQMTSAGGRCQTGTGCIAGAMLELSPAFGFGQIGNSIRTLSAMSL